ncbi:MAG: sensor domain-containing protein [Thermoleophilia bacterium]|nr:sensor domain-containing protein [Thermoleophilia bacterium]
MTSSRINPLARLGEGATYRRLAHVASALVLGPAWLVMLVVGWSVGVSLTIVLLLGLPILAGLAEAVRFCAQGERGLANGLLDAGIPRRQPPVRRPSFLRGLRAWITDPDSWREQAYLMARFVGGVPLAALVLGVIWAGLAALAAPAYYRFGGGIELGVGRADTLPEALALVPLGAVVLLLCPWLIALAASASRATARALLTPSTVQPARRPAPPPAELRRRALAIHAGVVVGLSGFLVVIWALTTPGGYFWPSWPMISLAVPLALHALVLARYPIGTGARGRLRALQVHAGIAVIVNAYLVAIWALSTPGRYFWVIWTMLAAALPVAAHAIWVAAGRGDREEMAARIDTLTATRAGAVDAQAAELRRIERDLHDGAQARLVALAMDLGMARERLSDAAPETRALVDDAHEHAKKAITELRDLARGIHPVVLTDRGLAAAIDTLVGDSGVPVELDMAPGARAPAAVEAAGYFVVAEALTNAVKHSRATNVRVAVSRRGPWLAIRVEDDGAGGADPAGSGLAGLRHRVEALDGVMTVTSPAGRGTVIDVEMPCGS